MLLFAAVIVMVIIIPAGAIKSIVEVSTLGGAKGVVAAAGCLSLWVVMECFALFYAQGLQVLNQL